MTSFNLSRLVGAGAIAAVLAACQQPVPNQPSMPTAKFVSALVHTAVRSMPHGITYANGKVYVCNNDPNQNVVSVLNAQTGAKQTEVTVGQSPTYALTSNSGNLVFVTNDASNSLTVIDATSDTVKGTANALGDNPFKIILSPDDRTAYVSLTGDAGVAKVNLSNPSSPVLAKTIAVDTAADDDRSITGLDTTVAQVNPKGNTLTLIDRATDATTSITVGLKPLSCAAGSFVSNGATKSVLVVCNSTSNNVSLIDMTTRTVVKTLDVGSTPTDSVGLAQYVYVTNNGSNTVSVIDTQAQAVVATLPVGQRPFHVFAAPRGGGGPASQVWVGNDKSTFATVIDATANTVYATVENQKGHHKMAFTPDGTRAFITNLDSGTVSVVDRTRL